MTEPVWVVGAAMLRFGRMPDRDLTDLAAEVTLDALGDAGVSIRDLQVLVLGTMNEAGSMAPQKLLRQVGQTGIPAWTVVNACATGATAVRNVSLALRAGEADIGLAVGVEKMGRGLLGTPPRTNDRYGSVIPTDGILGTAMMPGYFAQVGMEYMGAHDGVTADHFVRIAEKNHAHSTLNPLAQHQKPYTFEEIKAADAIAWPNTLPMCCPTGDGAAALVLASEAGLRRLGPDVRARAVKVAASVMTTDPWTPSDANFLDCNTLTRDAADLAYEAAGIGPEDLDLVELHDCFATAELVHYDNLRLCEPGGAADFLDSGAPWRDGTTPVNVSGGLISKGHPIGATGVAGIYEVVTHLRGEAGDRQIEGARTGLAHVLGLGSACCVHVLER